MYLRTILFIVLATVVGACSPSAPADGGSSSPPADTAAVKAAVEAANARFLDAFKRGDRAGMLANYADDAVVMMPNEEAWRGREAFEKGFAKLIEQVSYREGSATTVDIMRAGDLAIETGTFAWTLQAKAGPEIKDKGKYLTVWRHQPDGSWKIVRDINNSDLGPGK